MSERREKCFFCRVLCFVFWFEPPDTEPRVPEIRRNVAEGLSTKVPSTAGGNSRGLIEKACYGRRHPACPLACVVFPRRSLVVTSVFSGLRLFSTCTEWAASGCMTWAASHCVRERVVGLRCPGRVRSRWTTTGGWFAWHQKGPFVLTCFRFHAFLPQGGLVCRSCSSWWA